ncbi:serine protease [Kitasatospora sp. NBC_01266]|uniref:serine protease n=1 Tax=Kitasatospora sp. NBC_01266 TaxID=2903572 RepID=UPI002E36D842|nr:serine protease [Kitasatospora sp. NBC_01266]
MAGDLEGSDPADPYGALVGISTSTGRTLGHGFRADADGTVLTADEVVAEAAERGDGLRVRAAGESHPLAPGALTRCPELGLAWLTVDRAAVAGAPLPVAEAAPLPGQDVLLPGVGRGGLIGAGTALAGGLGQARLLSGVLLLDLPPGTEPVAGLPVLDPATGVVLGLLAPALRGLPDGLTGAIPLSAARSAGPAELAELLARNAVAAPAYGPALNLGGVLRLADRQLAAAGAGPGRIAGLAADRVERADGLSGEEPGVPLTVLVGEPGSGRTTELAALAVRRSTGARALPTLWLRGADLRAPDRCLRAVLARTLARLAAGADEAAVAQVCAARDRPLLVVLDAPEEAPGLLGTAWWTATLAWLAAARVRLLVACRPESWEQYSASLDPALLRLHRLSPLGGSALELAARQYGVTAGQQQLRPLLLRLAGELRAAGLDPTGAEAGELCQGWLDLRCLRIAERLAREGLRPASHRKGGTVPPVPVIAPGRVRRLAVTVAGRVHEAARRMLGPGQGGLGRAVFEELFPADGGWAAAVLAEGLFVPAGEGYRLAHEEVADWLQGQHLDLDATLRLLVEQDRPVARCVVPRHRVGAVEAALRSLARARGAAGLDPWLHRLWRPLAERDTEPGEAADEAAGEPADGEARWWAARLLAAGLRAGQDPQAHGDLLELMAERLAAAPARCASGTGPVARFGPGFWAELALPAERCWALLRLLVRADGPEQGFLALAAARLTATGVTAFPSLCRWFEDGRALPARPGATVADLAHDLLFAHRALGVDELTEALVDTAHPRADALLTVLAVEEPSALCRAVDRWSHDARPERHVAAAVHALRTAPYATGAGRELLRHTALTLLAREGEPGLHGAALALLVRDPATRARHLTGALAAYAADDPFIGPEVLGPALTTDTGAVLAAFEARLARPGPGAAAVLRVLADAPAGTGGSGAPGSLPDPATRLAGRLLRDRPERAELVAEYLNRRLTLGTAGRGDLTALLGAPPGERAAPVRRAFALVLASPQDDPGPTRALRREFLDRLLATEREPDVLAPALERLANGTARQDPGWTRAVVCRIALAWERGEGGPERWDALLVRCAGRAADFAQLLAEWPADDRPPAGGPLLARMRALLAQGRDPQYAAAEAERTPVRAVTAVLPRAAGVPVPGRGAAHGTL